MDMFKFKVQETIETNKKKWRRYSTKNILIVFLSSFLLSFFVFSISIYFQNKHLFLDELYESINDEYVSTTELKDLDAKIVGLLNEYDVKVIKKQERNSCKSNDQILINQELLNVCFNSREINYYLEFTKNEMFLANEMLDVIPYIFLISILVVAFLFSTDTKIFQKPSYIPLERDKIIVFINSQINELDNMLLNYTLSNFTNTLDKLYDYSIMFMDINIENYHLIEGKLRKLIETAKSLYFYDQSNQLHVFIKEIQIYYFKKNKKYLNFFASYFVMLTSRYYTSKIQLGSFILFFAAINAMYLKEIYEIPRFVNNGYIYYLSEVTSILSNLGGNIGFTTNTEYIYNIVLQLIGVIFVGILLGIITKEIR